jgi:hypothetical protein
MNIAVSTETASGWLPRMSHSPASSHGYAE